MRDIIDERDEKERISKSIIKFWNVNYIAKPTVEEEAESEAQKVLKRLEAEAAADEAAKQAEIAKAMEEARLREEEYNATTGSYSGAYGKTEVKDDVTKGQIDKILQEKDATLRNLIENPGDFNSEEE